MTRASGPVGPPAPAPSARVPAPAAALLASAPALLAPLFSLDELAAGAALFTGGLLAQAAKASTDKHDSSRILICVRIIPCTPDNSATRRGPPAKQKIRGPPRALRA